MQLWMTFSVPSYQRAQQLAMIIWGDDHLTVQGEGHHRQGKNQTLRKHAFLEFIFTGFVYYLHLQSP